MAENCWVVPLAMEGVAGLTAMDTRVAAVTVNIVDPETLPRVALMVVVPALTPEARPSLLAAFEMLATAGAEEVQVTVVVRFWMELSV